MEARQSGLLTVIAGMGLMLILGSIHAFSVFLEPLEAKFGVSRDLTSATYSIALVCLTFSVLFAHHIFARFRPAGIALTICLVAAAGCFATTYADNIYLVWLTYGVVFGSANGLGYALALQTAAQANPDNKGLAVGTITACYALGAATLPFLFNWAMIENGFSGAMSGLAIILALIGPLTFILMRMANTKLEASVELTVIAVKGTGQIIWKLWICYGTAVFAGLMIIGHATGILRTAGGSDMLVLLAPVTIAVFNMAGSLLGGFLADRIRITRLLTGLPLISSLALFALIFTNSPWLAILCLGVTGFAYGAIISVYPVAICNIFGPVAGIAAYGRIFTAWGAAGLAGPIIAGGLYMQFSGYHQALILASICGLVSAAFVKTIAGRGEYKTAG